MTMTPERIEEIQRIRRFWGESRHNIRKGNALAKYDIVEEAQHDVNMLLVALEESQQEYELMKFDRDALVKLVSNHQSAVDDACRELAEAQQTIARLREALEFLADDDNWSWCWVGTEDETVTWVGGTDPQDAARTALSIKEGSDKS